MSPELAEKIASLAILHISERDDLLLQAEATCEPAEFHQLRSTVANLMGEFQCEVLRALKAKHPNAVPEDLPGWTAAKKAAKSRRNTKGG